MAQYSPDFLASLKHRYEKTEQPMIGGATLCARLVAICSITPSTTMQNAPASSTAFRTTGVVSSVRLGL